MHTHITIFSQKQHIIHKECNTCKLEFFQFSQTRTIIHKNPAFNIFSNRFNLHQKSVSYIKMPRKCTQFTFKLFEPFIYMHGCNKFTYCMLYNKDLDISLPEKHSMQFLYIFTSNLHDIKLLHAYSYCHLFSKTTYYS